MAYNKILEDITPTEDHIQAYNDNQQFEIEQADRADAWRRKQALHKAFSSNLDAKGNLNERKFYIEASQAGLDPAQIGAAIDYHNKQIDQMSKIATEQPYQRSQGYTPESAGRNDAQYGNTDNGDGTGLVKVSSPSLAGAGAPLGPSAIDPDKLRDPSIVGEAKTETPAPEAQTATPVAPTTSLRDRLLRKLSGTKAEIKEAQSALGVKADGKIGAKTRTAMDRLLGTRGTNETGLVGRTESNYGLGSVDLVNGQVVPSGKQEDYADAEGGQVTINPPFQSKGEEVKMAPDNVGPDIFAPAPEDNRTFTQKFEDSYNKENAVTGAGAAITPPDDKLFTWNPKNDGSNAFQQYSSALASKLKANGFADASSFLHQIYTQTLKANMPTAPNEGLLSLGKEGIAKYKGEQKAYQAALQKAQGLAEAEVTKAKESLAEFAKGYGVNAETDEKFNADMGGRRAGGEFGSEIIRLRPVSEAEKTRGENIGNAYLDLKAAKGTEGFEGSYGMAMAKAKADGNVNRDVIVANLIAMGAVPSNKAVFVKSILDANGNVVGDGWNQLKAAIGGEFATDPAKQEKWYESASQNMKDAMKLVGYGIVGDKPNPNAGKKTGAAKKIGSKKAESRAERMKRLGL